MKEEKSFVSKILALRDSNPAEALSRVAELGNSFEEQFTASAVLIDCGNATNDASAIDRGIEILESLYESRTLNANLAYNLANGLQIRARMKAAAYVPVDGAIADDRLRARILFGHVMSAKRATSSTQSQMLTNIGNLFLETHRWIEALDCYQQAQHILPTNSVAAFCEIKRKMALANLFAKYPDTYSSHCSLTALKQRIRELGLTIDQNPDVFEEFSGRSAEITNNYTKQAKEVSIIESEALDEPYFLFVKEHNIGLSVYCSVDEYYSGKFDLLSIPAITTDIWNGPDVPEIFAMMNAMKADFAFARQTFFTVFNKEHTPYFETTSHADTLDYGLYGVRYAALTTAQRVAFDILDKVAVAVASYLKLKNAKKINFLQIWGSRRKTGEFDIRQEIKAEMDNGNQGIKALFQIFQDTSINEKFGPGFLGAMKQFRNSSTHRFTVLHDMGHDEPSDTAIVEHKGITEFEELTLSSLRLARAALFYFVDFIIYSEECKEGSAEYASVFTVPDHDYIRGRD